MFVNPKEPKFVFVDIPKTGTRSVLRALQKNFDGRTMKDHIMRIPVNYKPFYSFTIVRNPYDRVISLWWSTCKRDHDNYGFIKEMDKLDLQNTLEGFLQFVREARAGNVANLHRVKGNRLNFLTTQNDFLKHNTFNMVLRNEYLDDDFLQLPFIEDIKLPHINTTVDKAHNNPVIRPSSDELLTEPCVKLINAIYARDFAVLDYEKRKCS